MNQFAETRVPNNKEMTRLKNKKKKNTNYKNKNKKERKEDTKNKNRKEKNI
jgi:hypothetical protein